jgi:DNA-binding NtrC family response regulator
MSRGKVLIVDDDETILESLGRELAEEKYEVFKAKDVRAGLQTLAEQPVDVLISDLKMPGVQGESLLRIAKDRYPGVIRIIITGHPDLNSALQAINEAEVFRFFVKPWKRGELLSALTQAMRLRNSRLETRKLIGEIIARVEKLKALGPFPE